MKNTVKNIFDIAIKTWIKNDPRWEKKVLSYLEKQKKDYDKMDEKQKEFFDLNYLTNPYPDSKIYHIRDESKEIKKVIVWIDVEWPEILLVNEYNKRNKDSQIDLIIAHHPEEKALLDLDMVMKSVLVENDSLFWVPINQVEKIHEPRIWKVKRSINPINYDRPVHFAKMLNISFMWFHTPADNMCFSYLTNLINNNLSKIETVWDIVDILWEIPEMKISKKRWVWVDIWAWSKDSKAWKIVRAWITGGTNWDKNIYKKYAEAWIWTLLMMHINEEHLEEAKKHNLNVVITDHMASDSLWMNLILDEYEKLWIEIMEFSWFIRVSRVWKK